MQNIDVNVVIWKKYTVNDKLLEVIIKTKLALEEGFNVALTFQWLSAHCMSIDFSFQEAIDIYCNCLVCDRFT